MLNMITEGERDDLRKQERLQKKEAQEVEERKLYERLRKKFEG